MILIVGLGNPGEKFKNTRHNLGFRVVELFREKNNSPDFKFSKKFNAEISEDFFNNEKIILAKPQTFMNESGKSVRKIISGFKCNPLGSPPAGVQQVSSLVVVHDDIDLPLGKIRISKSRGSAGHKGIESIIEKLGMNNFVRLRVGILPKTGKPKNPEKFVLQKFRKDEKERIERAIEKSVNALDLIVKRGVEKAMNEYNK